VWVVDANRKVYVYNTSGALLGSWTAGTLASNATPEGIATNGTDVWIVDAKQDRVYRYAGAASRTSGSQTAASSFSLNGSNSAPKDLVSNGVNVWVVNDSTTDKVFKYNVSGSLVGSWTINGGGGSPTGITLDPLNVSNLWIVDSNTDRVYQFDTAASRISGSQGPSTSFVLAAGNTNPQGIADPPVPSVGGLTTPLDDVSTLLAFDNDLVTSRDTQTQMKSSLSDTDRRKRSAGNNSQSTFTSRLNEDYLRIGDDSEIQTGFSDGVVDRHSEHQSFDLFFADLDNLDWDILNDRGSSELT